MRSSNVQLEEEQPARDAGEASTSEPARDDDVRIHRCVHMNLLAAFDAPTPMLRSLRSQLGLAYQICRYCSQQHALHPQGMQALERPQRCRCYQRA